MGVSKDFVEECHLEILHDNMDISKFMVHAHEVEDTQLKWKNRYFKREKSYEGCTSMVRLEIYVMPRLKNRVSNKVPYNFPKENKDMVSNPKSQKARSGYLLSDKPICSNCGKKHCNKCLVGTRNCFGCGKEIHKVKDFPNVSIQEMESSSIKCS